jgi:nucleoside-diphosphate-sugar epimerase
MRILVTGANGFVGRRLCAFLYANGHYVRKAVRIGDGSPDTCPMNESTPDTDLRAVLKDIDCVIHLAARVHAIESPTATTKSAYDLTNVQWTKRLATAAREAGVCRFIFLSSIGVCGSDSRTRPFCEQHEPSPQNLYASSKWDAEKELAKIGGVGSMELVIIRPALVYGEEVKANFLSLLSAINLGIPLPFGSLTNRRSFLYLDNLVSVLGCCVDHPAAAGQTFHVCDGESIALPDLQSTLSLLMGRKPRMFPCPKWLLEFAGKIFRQRQKTQSLLNSLEVDSSKIRKILHWTPPYTAQQGMARTVAWYMKTVDG